MSPQRRAWFAEIAVSDANRVHNPSTQFRGVNKTIDSPSGASSLILITRASIGEVLEFVSCVSLKGPTAGEWYAWSINGYGPIYSGQLLRRTVNRKRGNHSNANTRVYIGRSTNIYPIAIYPVLIKVIKFFLFSVIYLFCFYT